jgi:hypothetical protein
MAIGRSAFLAQLTATFVALDTSLTRAASNPPDSLLAAPDGAPVQSFIHWIKHTQIDQDGLCRYYKGGRFPHMASPLATAYAGLFLVDHDRELAIRLGHAIVALQQKHLGNVHVSGGVPSIANEPSPFYSSDALIALKLMVTLGRLTGDDRFFRAASHFVRFLHRMADGVLAGVLKTNVSVPMEYVTIDGKYQNAIVPNVSMMFFDALRDFALVMSDNKALTLYEQGSRWLLAEAQSPLGPFYDHYDPGYPAVPYRPDRWKWSKADPTRRVVIGDNTFMAALGAQSMGGTANVTRFIDWLRPVNGKFYAYMLADDGSPAFLPGAHRYFDVVCSGMYQMLMRRAGRSRHPQVARAAEALRDARASDGGFYWGLYEDGGQVDDAAEALVTGVWATLNDSNAQSFSSVLDPLQSTQKA